MTAGPVSDIAVGYRKLLDISEKLAKEEAIEVTTVRDLFKWFGSEERDDATTHRISAALLWCNIRTEPWFADQFMDGKLEFWDEYFSDRPLDEVSNLWINKARAFIIKKRMEAWIKAQSTKPTQAAFQAKLETLAQIGFNDFTSQEWEAAWEALHNAMLSHEEREAASHAIADKVMSDPGKECNDVLPLRRSSRASDQLMAGDRGKLVFGPWVARQQDRVPEASIRVRRLLSRSNSIVRSVKSEDSVNVAITLMSLHDFSQLPVMDNDRDVKGVVSWRSITDTIHRAPGIGLDKKASQYTDKRSVSEVSADAALLDTIKQIAMNEYALVRDTRDKRIIGIITTSDLSEELQILSEPFLLIQQIETQVRALILKAFEAEGPIKIADRLRVREVKSNRALTGIFDLDFGDYTRLLQQKDFWDQVGLRHDRGTLLKAMEDVRKIRNSVMHFKPESIGDRIDHLRNLNSFFLDLAPSEIPVP